MKYYTFFMLLSIHSILFCQTGSNVDLNFNSSNYFDNLNYPNGSTKVGKQSDGKIIVLTHFDIGDSHLNRFFPNGDIDNSFEGDELGFPIYFFKIQNDDKIIVSDEKKVIRLNIDGTIDQSFQTLQVGLNVDDYINGIEICNNNKIIVYGIFEYCNNQVVNSKSIIRLNQDGTLDYTFNSNGTGGDINIPGVPQNRAINNVKSLDDGRMIILGAMNYNNVICNNFVRINNDGTIDTTFHIGSGFSDTFNLSPSIFSVGLTNDDKYIVTGGFSSYQSHSSKYIVRINSDGTVDESFVSPYNNFVFGLEVFWTNIIFVRENGKILAGGSGNASCEICQRLTQLNADGSFDESFNNERYFIRNPNNPAISDMILENGKDLIIVGFFDKVNGIQKASFARIDVSENKIFSKTYNDFNQNCLHDSIEVLLSNKNLIINPGNHIVETNSQGKWYLDSLPTGTYTITIDTSNTNWTPTCPITQTFTVIHPDSLTIAPSFGMVSNNPCPSPTVSVNMPFMRPCFTNQQIYVQACNEYDATGILPNAFSIVELDPNLIFESASLPYTSLGNNLYRFEHDILYPGQCVNYTISTQVDCNAPLGLTLCLEANLYPVADCVLDTLPKGEVTPCTLPWDQSSLSVEGWCANDSIYFTITNTGQLGGGDMECYSPVRIYIDGVPYLLDSIKLLGGETFTYVFAGDGATWILEADQHPLHPGNSHPNAHVENCNPGNWTPDIVNNFPQDDADPVKDIYCGVVTGSYDPNDKKGTPYGLGAEHEVLPNQDIEYLIRFQNTGTDTAFTVVVRDTLDLDFDIFSVTAGSASHNYSFRMYGPRVLEWTFPNILLPDSTTNEVASHGFLSYRVKQKPNLADGTLLTNDADIYFDFNAPIITNETSHKVQRRTFEPTNPLIQLSESKTGIKVYPNPTKSQTTLSFSTYQKQVSYKLLNLSGLVVLEKSNLYGKEVKVSLSDIPNGMYLMQISTAEGIEIMKIVKE